MTIALLATSSEVVGITLLGEHTFPQIAHHRHTTVLHTNHRSGAGFAVLAKQVAVAFENLVNLLLRSQDHAVGKVSELKTKYLADR